MPSIRDHVAAIEKMIDDAGNYAAEGAAQITKFDETMIEIKTAVVLLGAMAVVTVTRYDYWRRMYSAKTQMSESDFDAMTDECIIHEGEPEEACRHLVVNTIGRCANCGKRV